MIFCIRAFDFCHSSRYNNCRKIKEGKRIKLKYYVELTRQERQFAIDGLNRFQNKLIAAGRYTDAVDELPIKVAKANQKLSYFLLILDLLVAC